MNIKNIVSLFICFLAMLEMNSASAVTTIPERVSTTAVTVPADINDTEETDIIKRVSFRDKFKRSPEVQINNFFKKYNHYSSKKDIDKLKDMYSESFVNNDGFGKETIFKLMEMASTTYKEIKYNTDIQSIDVKGNYAVVKAHETASGETDKPMQRIGQVGTISSDIYYTDYLRKEGNNWKILTSVINYEKVDLKYGETKNINIDIYAPDYVSQGSEYEVTVKINTPSESFAVGSIVNEPITFPQKSVKDAFKTIKNDELSRIVKSNTTNNNEYATVSLALTRAKVEPDNIELNMTGIAIAMKRVNVLRINNVNVEEEEQNAKTSKE